MPSTPFIGVRISWLMLARKSPLAWLASMAAVTGSVAMKKFTMGAQALFPTLLQEKDLRLFKEKIDASSFMPGGQYAVWPAADASVQVSTLYQQFARRPNLPKLLSPQTVTNTVADAIQRGVLALRYVRPDGSEQWFWRSKIEVADWEKSGEAWLPSNGGDIANLGLVETELRERLIRPRDQRGEFGKRAEPER